MNEPTELAAVLNSVWERRQSEIQNEVMRLQDLSAHLDSSDTQSEIWNESRRIVHQLIGLFGILQFQDCVLVCREINESVSAEKIEVSSQTLRSEISTSCGYLAELVNARTK